MSYTVADFGVQKVLGAASRGHTHIYTKKERMERKAVIKREKGKYTVWIPDVGWVDCGPDCPLCKAKDKEQQLVKTHGGPFSSIKEAVEYALWLGFKNIELPKKEVKNE